MTGWDTSADHKPFPLTELQYAYWVGRGSSFVLGNVAPHAYFELEGKRLDVELLAVTWRRLVERHGALRAVVGEDGAQRILASVPPFEIVWVDLRDLDAAKRDEHLSVTRAEMSHRVYTAADWPLFDLRLTRLAEHDRLHISLDLLMVDLASVAVLFSEWSALYRQPELQLPPLDVSFRDYVLALEQARDTPQYARSLEYWTDRAETLAPPPELPLARSPASVHKPVFTHREHRLAPDAWRRFQDNARGWGLTPSAALATAFSEVLALWAGGSQFMLNLTLFNRLPLVLSDDGAGHRMVHPHLRGVVGDFTSICLLEMDMTSGGCFGERARLTQRQLQQDLKHRYASALYTLRERRRRGLTNGFETMPVVFTSGLGTVADLSRPMEDFGDLTYRVSQTPQVWLDHQVVDITGTLELSWDAVEGLFASGVLDDMFATYTELVERLADDEELWRMDLVVVLPSHQSAERARANATATAPSPSAELLHEPFLARVKEQPQHPAVISSAGTISYSTLACRARGVAAALSGIAAPDALVGVVTEKSIGQVVATYGVLIAGSAYLPVNPALPAQRQEQILADGGAVAIVTDEALDKRLEWPDAIPRTLLTQPPVCTARASSAEPHDLAYVIYTSGSTGSPKGVMIEHRAVLNTILDINELFGIGAGDRVLGLADLGFDLSVYDIFGAHAAGATLVLPDPGKTADPAHWAELMSEHGVTVWNSVPAQMEMLVEYLEAGSDIPEALSTVMLSGDWIPVDLPARITELWPQARVISLGGATEVSIWSIYHLVGPEDAAARSVPYGKPLRNQRLHVLDARLEHSPTWVAGELYIEGQGLARGYWGDPEKTAASFIEHPVSGVRLYRTGDHARYLPGGDIQFLGRRDGQVKIGGHRIELGEIEAVLRQHPGVERAVVVKGDDPSGEAKLVAYVVPAADDGELFETEYGDPATAARSWREIERVASIPASGPPAPALLSVWEALDALHVVAVAVAFRALDLPHRRGAAFEQATIARAAGIPPRYARWIGRAVDALRQNGYLGEDTGGLVVTRDFPREIPAYLAEHVRRELHDTLEVDADVIAWFLSLAGSVAGILAQDVHSAELYTNDRTPGVYARLFGPAYSVATEAVRRLAQGWPPDRRLRVLEVGAGYGSLTPHLLASLPADRTEYVFTDISMFFLAEARRTFAGHPCLRAELFDLDRAPQAQGFDGHRADLVIAASVLHDTRQIRATLGHLRSVLAPDGVLLIVEQTVFSPWFDLTMGLQQGFDNFADTDLRDGHPLLDRDGWQAELAAAGFPAAAVLTRSGGPAAVGFDVIVARGPAERRRFAPEVLRGFLAERLPKHMVPARISALDELPLSSAGKVDRAALVKATAGIGRSRPAEAPRTDRQRKLVEIWREVLGLSEVGITDDFLEAGGDSLLAARLVAAIKAAFGVTVPVSVVLEHPTVDALDRYLEEVLA
jgi:pyochelin synthetase